MIDHYDWAGGREAMLRFGTDTGPVVILALPLFEEANRTRAFAVAILRHLAELGIGGALPDLPGQGESLVPLENLTLLRMREAYDELIARFDKEGRRSYGAAIRSGALLDVLGLLFGRWHFSPQAGASLLRELTRTKSAETGKQLSSSWYFDGSLPVGAPDPPVEIAGNIISPDMLTGLSAATPFGPLSDVPRRTIRLLSDLADADRKVDGVPLWRRSEPENNIALAQTLATDIAEWIATCER